MSELRIGLLVAASFILGIGLFQAIDDYRLAFDDSLNQWHVMHGLVWNIGTYTTARMLVWWAGAITPQATEPTEPSDPQAV